jgi:integrase/recombinase XerD
MDAHWQDCLDLFLQTLEDRSGSIATRRAYSSDLLRFLAMLDDPGRATRSDVLHFMHLPSVSKRNRGDPVTAATKNHRRTVIASFYTFASGYYVGDVPLYQRPLPTLGLHHLKQDVHYLALNLEELQRLFAVMPTNTVKGLRDRALFLTYFWTARRRSEIIGLRWQEIQPAIIDGRATHTYQYRAKGTSRTVRTAELPAPAYQAIIRYLEAACRLETIKGGDPVFTSSHPGQGYSDSRTNVPLNREFANRELKRYAILAGLSPEISIHALRHSAARARYEALPDIRAIQQILGHVSIATTDSYLKVLMPLGDPGAQLLEERFGNL